MCRQGGTCQAFANAVFGRNLAPILAVVKPSAGAEDALIALNAAPVLPVNHVNQEKPMPRGKKNVVAPEAPPVGRRKGGRRKATDGMLVLIETEKASGLFQRSADMNMSEFIKAATSGRAVLTASEWRQW